MHLILTALPEWTCNEDMGEAVMEWTWALGSLSGGHRVSYVAKQDIPTNAACSSEHAPIYLCYPHLVVKV